ncbi:MAG: DUF2059 domain-containing protein [Salinarimonadaceae bacterium]|nr:MAG: DUF2059 domain-containing protein [Salinarimonadaceae bacterium]
MKPIATFLAALGFAALLFSPTGAQAQSEAMFETARSVVIGSGIDQSFDEVVPAATQALRRRLVTQPTAAAAIDDILKEMAPELALQKRAMVNRAARVVAEVFTEEELTAIDEFFKSDAGRRFVEMQARILEGVFAEMQAWNSEVAEYIQVRVSAEMASRGIQMR